MSDQTKLAVYLAAVAQAAAAGESAAGRNNQVRTAVLDAPDGWMQGRALFGGLIAAAAVKALRGGGVGQELRSLNVQFIGPAQAAGLQLESRVLRAGKTVTHAIAMARNGNLEQTPADQTLMSFSFGDDRPTVDVAHHQSMPAVPAPDELKAFPYIAGLTPEFTRQFEMRWSTPHMPFSAASSRELNGWIRLREPQGLDGETVAVMMLDAFPTPVLPCMPAPAPISTVSWSAHFVADVRTSQATGWWFYTSELLFAKAGFAYDQRRLWDSEGRLVATATQACAYFA